MRANAMTETYENVTVFGHPMIFTCLRLDKTTVPAGYFVYEVRHDDFGEGDPAQIAKWVMVNHWGTIISNRPIALEPSQWNNNAIRDVDPEKDWNYEGEATTLQEYMSQYQPVSAEETPL